MPAAKGNDAAKLGGGVVILYRRQEFTRVDLLVKEHEDVRHVDGIGHVDFPTGGRSSGVDRRTERFIEPGANLLGVLYKIGLSERGKPDQEEQYYHCQQHPRAFGDERATRASRYTSGRKSTLSRLMLITITSPSSTAAASQA